MDITLTPYQRLNLYNQYTILEQLALIRNDESEAKYYSKLAKIAFEGYSHEYYEITDIIQEEFSYTNANFVWNVLDMYSCIYYSYNGIDNSQISFESIKFRGFDGNNEAEFRAYCSFIVNELDRYTEFKGGDFNSHAPSVHKYSIMLQKWNEMGKPCNLSEKQIMDLFK